MLILMLLLTAGIEHDRAPFVRNCTPGDVRAPFVWNGTPGGVRVLFLWNTTAGGVQAPFVWNGSAGGARTPFTWNGTPVGIRALFVFIYPVTWTRYLPLKCGDIENAGPKRVKWP